MSDKNVHKISPHSKKGPSLTDETEKNQTKVQKITSGLGRQDEIHRLVVMPHFLIKVFKLKMNFLLKTIVVEA